MRIKQLVLFTIAAGTVAAPLVAQPPSERVEIRRGAGDTKARVWVNGDEIDPLDFLANRRARLGITMQVEASANDSIGATIVSVTPASPAAKAGLRAGDIVTRYNGQRLVGTERDRSAAGNESYPGLRMVELAAKLEPGDTAALEYRRDKETRTVNVIASNERMLTFRSLDGQTSPLWMPDPPVPGQRRVMSLGAPDGDVMFRRFGGPFAELELAPINPDLGTYFGTSEGVLVIDTPRDNTLGLKGGDVVLSVDGRAARGPSSLLRILHSYEQGDVMKLEILRNKSRQTISTKIDWPRDD
ncbi:MAG: PDZ domain-containing protein [Gemmatimonadales bacterium]